MGAKQLHTHERMLLQACIEKEMSLQDTCARLKKTRFTIYREIHRHCYIKQKQNYGCSNCKKFLTCKKQCKSLFNCTFYDPVECEKLKRFPYVCNCCKRKTSCSLKHKYYDFEKAIDISHQKRRDHHIKISITEKDLSMINKYVTDGLKKGQSIHHIYVNNSCVQIVSERTIRRYLYSGKFSVGPSELPRYVRFKHKSEYDYRKHRPASLKYLIGRTFNDYKEYISRHKVSNIIQLDTVIGKNSDGKVILTIYFTKTHFMFGILVDKGNPTSINNALIELKKTIGMKYWKKAFSVILTDNGFEFSKLIEIECDENGEKISNVFFCNPYSSWEKGGCERNHEFIRYVISKGISFENLTQNQVDILFSHINSYTRSSLDEKTPYELTKEFLDLKFLNLIGITRIPPNLVNLRKI